MKAYAEARSGRTGASRGGMVSTPSRPTNPVGIRLFQGARTHMGGSGRGPGVRATYVPPRRGRAG